MDQGRQQMRLVLVAVNRQHPWVAFAVLKQRIRTLVLCQDRLEGHRGQMGHDHGQLLGDAFHLR